MTEVHPIQDSYFDTLNEAVLEAQRRRASHEELITRLRQSRYGGFVVHSIPVELFVDELAEPQTVHTPPSQVIYG